jgi:hypothetical protein
MASGDVINDDMENRPERYALATAHGRIVVSTDQPSFQHVGSVNGAATVWLSCRCGLTTIVELTEFDTMEYGNWPDYEVPRGWAVELRDVDVEGSATVVRCPEHKNKL